MKRKDKHYHGQKKLLFNFQAFQSLPLLDRDLSLWAAWAGVLAILGCLGSTGRCSGFLSFPLHFDFGRKKLEHFENEKISMTQKNCQNFCSFSKPLIKKISVAPVRETIIFHSMTSGSKFNSVSSLSQNTDRCAWGPHSTMDSVLASHLAARVRFSAFPRFFRKIS